MTHGEIWRQKRNLLDAGEPTRTPDLRGSMDDEYQKPSQETLTFVRRRAEDADVHPEDELSSEQFWAGINRRYGFAASAHAIPTTSSAAPAPTNAKGV